MTTYTSDVENYIEQFDQSVRTILNKMIETITQVIPGGILKISYGVLAIHKRKNIIHFGGYRNYVSLYPGSEAVAYFKEKLEQYATSKGTIRFLLNQEVPYQLIGEIASWCLTQLDIKTRLRTR